MIIACSITYCNGACQGFNKKKHRINYAETYTKMYQTLVLQYYLNLKELNVFM